MIRWVGWVLIWASIASWIAESIAGSIQTLRGEFDLHTMLLWTYFTLIFLIIGIFMAQYEPDNEKT